MKSNYNQFPAPEESSVHSKYSGSQSGPDGSSHKPSPYGQDRQADNGEQQTQLQSSGYSASDTPAIRTNRTPLLEHLKAQVALDGVEDVQPVDMRAGEAQVPKAAIRRF